jgi:hypothetical protein
MNANIFAAVAPYRVEKARDPLQPQPFRRLRGWDSRKGRKGRVGRFVASRIAVAVLPKKPRVWFTAEAHLIDHAAARQLRFMPICDIVSTKFYIDQYNGLFRQYRGFLINNHYFINISIDWPVFIYWPIASNIP